MANIVELVIEGKYDQANKVLEESMVTKLRSTLHAAKKKLAAKDYTGKPTLKSMSGKPIRKLVIKPKEVAEETEETLDEARVNIVKLRIRGGKVQRRKKVSAVAGMTMRGGKLTRMSPAERRRRKMGARRAKLKIRAKKSQMLRKRKLSIAKRKRLGY